jgi:hypothetical protein
MPIPVKNRNRLSMLSDPTTAPSLIREWHLPPSAFAMAFLW